MENEPSAESTPEQGARLQELSQSVQDIEARFAGASDAVHELNDQAVRFISEKPLAAIGIAFGVGYVVGKLAARRWLV